MSRLNNFDLLRLAFAATVMMVHLHALSVEPSLAFLSATLSSELAVQGFFVISGYLVLMSYKRSAGLSDYAQKRIRRVYPAYFAVVLGCALLGWLFTTVTTAEYFSAAWLRYVAANLVFLNFLAPELPGLFESNPWRAVNGALWTIKLEIGFYVAVPAIVWLARRSRPWIVLGGVYLASVFYWWLLERSFQATGREAFQVLARQLPGQLAYFAVGAAGYWYADSWRGRALPVAVLGILALWLMPAAMQPLLRPLVVGVLVIGAAMVAPYLGNFGRYGDFSYGIYILHFPVIQVLVASGWFHRAPGIAAVGAVVIVAALAWLSWHLVEKPMLGASSHYVKAADRDGLPAPRGS